MEYGLQFYRYSHARGIGSKEELVNLTQLEPRVLCIAEDKALEELSHLPDVEMEIVRTIGSRTAFWASKSK